MCVCVVCVCVCVCLYVCVCVLSFTHIHVYTMIIGRVPTYVYNMFLCVYKGLQIWKLVKKF